MTLELTGPAGLDRLDEVTVRIRDDIPDRSARPGNGLSAEQVAAVIWGPYRFAAGVRDTDASAVIASHGWYHTLPWFPVAVTGYLGLLLALRQIPVVARALAAPGMVSRMELPQTPRVAGVAFLLYMAFGYLPALFALPAGLGDIAAGIAALLVTRRLAQGTGHRAALWFNAFGMTDLVVALTLGALTGFQLLNVTPSSAPITELPLALIPTATVPLFFALHITAVSRAGEGSADTVAHHRPAHCHREIDGYATLLASSAYGARVPVSRLSTRMATSS